MASNFVDKQCMKFVLQPSSSLTFVAADVDIVNDQVTVENHGIATGTAVGLTTTGAVPTGLTATTTAYYIIQVDGSTIAFATSRANAHAGTKIDLTAVGSGTTTVHQNAIGDVILGILPDNFLITGAYYDVITTFTSATDAATIALTAEGAGDLKAAIAISDATNVWDSGAHGCLPGNWALDGAALTAIAMAAGRAGAFVQTSATRNLTATIAGNELLTAGKLYLYVEGLQSEE